MHPNAALIDRFYRAFQARDAAAMAACYHPGAVFSDPVFPRLEGDEVGAMWAMLCERGTDLVVTFGDIEVTENATGYAQWEARYTFSPTGRVVHNQVEGRFAFEDGLIKGHRDVFDFHRWARQALGPTGWLLGWTPWLRTKVQRQARAGLDRFVAKRGSAER